jgi:K+-sensing histidine kinase KdpD
MLKLQASCVSHDMRAPLGAITCIVDNIIANHGNKKKLVKLLKPVRYAAKILNLQVFNLLDYNLFEADNFRIDP